MGPVIRRLLRFVGGLLGSSWLRLRAALGVPWFSPKTLLATPAAMAMFLG